MHAEPAARAKSKPFDSKRLVFGGFKEIVRF
jgi:uncharacterized protein YbaA (DUF1428 family)